jgi:hypothetical protein
MPAGHGRPPSLGNDSRHKQRDVMQKHVLSAAALAAALTLGVATTPARAVTIIDAGAGASGALSSGAPWTAGPNVFGFPTWTVPLVNNMFPIFNPTGISNGAGDFAVEVDFYYTGTVRNPFNTSFDTGFTKIAIPEGTVWNTRFVSPTEVAFTAPAGTELDPGDTYLILAGFRNQIDPSTFSFRLVWTDQRSVPEPMSAAVLGTGLAGLLVTRRRRKIAAD